jgi:Putative amidoligase enzyme
MASPRLKLLSHAAEWRSWVEATWRYLQKQYHITGSPRCGTHIYIHVSPDALLLQVKRLAQAVIYFEPAFDDLVPPHRRGRPSIKSNWHNRLGLCGQGLSRLESIKRIEQQTMERAVENLMHHVDEEYSGERRRVPNTSRPTVDDYAWNFRGFKENLAIVYRQPPCSLNSDEALSWAELVGWFARAALTHSHVYWEQRDHEDRPSNITALRGFLNNAVVQGLHEPDRLKGLWKNAEDRERGASGARRRDNALGRQPVSGRG